SNLALAYKATGRLAEATELLERTLGGSERMLGAKHPDTLTVRGNLALAYKAARRTAEAVALLEQTLADSEPVFGADHPRTLTARHNLAMGYFPDTAASGYTLATLYQAVRALPTVIPLLEQTFTDCERVLGADHPETLKVLMNLASAY